MKYIVVSIHLFAILLLVGENNVMAQRGHGGGRAGGGRAGMTRPGGGMTRPGGGMNMPSRPSGGMTRPSTRPYMPSQPGGGMTRPSTRPNVPSRPGGATRPNLPGNIAGGNRPGTRPNLPGGGATRPNLPGNIGSTRPNLPGAGATRPNLPGNIGSTRPNLPGAGTRPNLPGGGTRPSLPGNIAGGDRPGTRPNLPGGSTRPNLPGGGNRPGAGGLIPGDLTRPRPLPEIGGGRPGIGNRPGLGDLIAGNRPGTRPGQGGGGQQINPGDLIRPGFRPGQGGGGQQLRPGDLTRPNFRPGRPGIGGGNQVGDNIGQIGDNIINRPNFGGNNYYFNNTTHNNWFGGGGWGGGNWGGGGWGGGNWGGGWGRWNGRWGGWNGRWGGGWWNNPYRGFHRNWHRGWGNNFVNINLGGWGWGAPVFGVYNMFPTWGMTTFSGWGLGSLATNWMSSSFVNPFFTAPVVAAGAPTTVVFDYSQPINVAAAPPAEAVAEDAVSQFDQARAAFQNGDFATALTLTDAAIGQLPNDPTLHEFRALVLFALGRFDEAATVAYAVLTAGPGWNWSTMAGLYSDTDIYTNQLRALEAFVRDNPTSASGQFLLGYHYLVQGHTEAARLRFVEVNRLQPSDTLSARFVEALTPPEEPAPTDAPPTAQPTSDIRVASADETAPSEAEAEPPPPTPPPASLAGTWTAKPDPTLTIALTLGEDGAFTWEVQPEGGPPQTITGQADYQTGDEGTLLALLQQEGPPLAGKVENPQPSQFDFHLLGGDNAPRLTFTR